MSITSLYFDRSITPASCPHCDAMLRRFGIYVGSFHFQKERGVVHIAEDVTGEFTFSTDFYYVNREAR